MKRIILWNGLFSGPFRNRTFFYNRPQIYLMCGVAKNAVGQCIQFRDKLLEDQISTIPAQLGPSIIPKIEVDPRQLNCTPAHSLAPGIGSCQRRRNLIRWQPTENADLCNLGSLWKIISLYSLQFESAWPEGQWVLWWKRPRPSRGGSGTASTFWPCTWSHLECRMSHPFQPLPPSFFQPHVASCHL